LSDADRRTALLVIAREAEPVVREWRLRYLREWVDRGIPPHLTILFPFVPEHEIGDEILTALERLYALVPPFDYTLESVESFPDAAWLAPAPAEPFLDLIARTRAAFPDRPPYGNPEHVPVPHCTIGADDDPTRVEAMVRELRSGLGPQLPVRCHAVKVSLVGERADGSWVERGAFPLEGRR
jgi:2'-5' RNA ligase